jgi:hypothetical protein
MYIHSLTYMALSVRSVPALRIHTASPRDSVLIIPNATTSSACKTSGAVPIDIFVASYKLLKILLARKLLLNDLYRWSHNWGTIGSCISNSSVGTTCKTKRNITSVPQTLPRIYCRILSSLGLELQDFMDGQSFSTVNSTP